jgi:hypothetical protein
LNCSVISVSFGTKSRPRNLMTSGNWLRMSVGKYVSSAVQAVTTACRSS